MFAFCRRSDSVRQCLRLIPTEPSCRPSLPTKRDNPAVPITIAEQVESTHGAFEAGATLLHAHVRNDDGAPTSDPSRFALLMGGVRKHCPGIIIQLSTDGRSSAGCERRGMLTLRQIFRPASTRMRQILWNGSPPR